MPFRIVSHLTRLIYPHHFLVLRILIGRKLNTSLYSHEFCLLSYNSLSQVRLLHSFSRSINSLQKATVFPQENDQHIDHNHENMVPDFGIIFRNADDLLSSQQSSEQLKSQQISPLHYLNRCIVIYGRSEQVKIRFSLPLTQKISYSFPDPKLFNESLSSLHSFLSHFILCGYCLYSSQAYHSRDGNTMSVNF
jgi:hypothetical protein